MTTLKKADNSMLGDDEGEVPYPLREYQKAGVRFLRTSDSALLADEMGLGKTVQTIVALNLDRVRYKRVLLITPSSLCLNWYKELQKWAPGLRVRRVTGDAEERSVTYRLPIQILIASYEQVRADHQRIFRTVAFDLVILDEAQRIKNADSETSFACRALRRGKAWALSGTPLENAPSDLLSIFGFLKPGLLHIGMSRAEMHQAMAKHFLRRTKAEVLAELPPILWRDLRIELRPKQRNEYDKIWESRRVAVSSAGHSNYVGNMLALVTKLKQICNLEPVSGESAKLDAMRTFVDNVITQSEKVLIFSQYVETLRWLANRIDIPSSVFHGGLSPDARDEMITNFKNETGAFALLMSVHAGGVGLNLSEASTVIMFDRWWNPAVENQAIQRAHRFGREMPLQVIRFVISDSIEERIIEILEEKSALFDEYIEDAPGIGAGRINEGELKRILALA